MRIVNSSAASPDTYLSTTARSGARGESALRPRFGDDAALPGQVESYGEEEQAMPRVRVGEPVLARVTSVARNTPKTPARDYHRCWRLERSYADAEARRRHARYFTTLRASMPPWGRS